VSNTADLNEIPFQYREVHSECQRNSLILKGEMVRLGLQFFASDTTRLTIFMPEESQQQPETPEHSQPGGPTPSESNTPQQQDQRPSEQPPQTDQPSSGDAPRNGQTQERRPRDRFRPRHQYRQRTQGPRTPQATTPQAEPEEKREERREERPAPQQQQRQQSSDSTRGQQQQGRLDVSVVVPLYNEEESLKELHQQLRTALSRISNRYEIIFVDDGSTDRSFEVLRSLKRFDNRTKIIRFRRNYGKSAALSVGFQNAQGNVVVTMDADLQDDPTEIPSLVKRINEGYDLVSGWKKKRRDPITKTIPSRFFNFVTSLMTGIKLHDFNCGLKAYKRDVVKTVKVYGELHRYVPVLAHWEGFRIGEMVVNHRPRKYGKTKFGFGRFWKGFLDLLTVLFTTRYFRRPLHLFGFWGLVFLLGGLVVDGWLVVDWFNGQALSNRPLFLGGILLIIVGIQFVSIGLLGEMISKTKQSDEEYAIRDFIR
jgi:glycosyltransferase involved in cell wall biosynthesis